MRMCTVLAAMALCFSATAAERDKADFTRPGQMKAERYVRMGSAQPIDDLRKADELYRRRQYDAARRGYVNFARDYADSREQAIRDAVPYATLMEGMCLLQTGKLAAAPLEKCGVMEEL